MVATVLRLRYRILANNLARRPWQLVGFCFGMLWALSLLALLVIALVAVSALQGLEVARTIAVIGGALLLLGWLVGPLLLAGIDTTVDAGRLAPFPLRRTQVMSALAAAGLTGVPGIMTTLAAFASVILWLRWPAAAAIAVPCVVIGVLTCVVATQAMSTWSTGLGGNRRGREIVGTLVLLALIMTGPVITGILALLDQATGDLAGRVAEIAVVLGWTPLGAAWAVPGDVAAGSGLTAAVKLVLATGTLALLWWLWGRALEGSLSSPARTSARVVARGALGLIGRMPTGGVGATWARALTAWLRDPRYLRQLLVIPLFPILFAFATGIDSWLFTSSALMAALVLSITGYADISYDGTAFASVLSTGIRGRDDRLGRLLAAATVGVPLLILLAVTTTAIAGTWSALPAILGAGLGLQLAGYGVTAVSSALIVVPVAAPGDSPFKTVPGQTFVNGLLVFVVWAVCLVLATPTLILAAVGSVTGEPAWGWAALAAGPVLGVVVIAVGVAVGGRTLDRTGPDLLARIKAFPA